MRVLITGSEGFLGSSIFFYLSQKEGFEVFTLDLIPPLHTESESHFQVDCAAIGDIVSKLKLDLIINASGSANVQASFKDPELDKKLNFEVVQTLLDAIKMSGEHTKFLNFSSAAVYGSPKKLPISEKDDVLSEPISPYGKHKKMSEELMKDYFLTHQVKSHSLRVFSCYGPGQQKLLFWDIYKKLNGSDENFIKLFGTGEESRDYIFIDDLCQAISCIIDKAPFDGSSINVAIGKDVAIRYAAEKALELIRPEFEILFNGENRKGDPKNWRANIGKLQSFGFMPHVSFEEGIEKYYKWVLSLEG